MKFGLAIPGILALAFTGAAIAQEKGVMAIDATEVVITVVEVDQDARTVTVVGPKGNSEVLNVPPEAQNLDQVHPGAKFKVRYVESIAISIKKGGAASSSEGRAVRLAPKGDIPGGMMVNVHQISGVVEEIDYAKRLVSLRGPKGNLLVVPAGEEVQNLEQVQVGDLISLEYTESLAMRMIKE
jgi:hypothetical protein